MYNRWYDENPTLGLAISLLRNTTLEVRTSCATFIVERAKALNVTLKHNLLEYLDFTLKRWYDSEQTLMEAMEYIRNSSVETQKKLALEIIDYLQHKR